ncbi:hypothetical protein HK100_001397 [Physocladia obscura]|uniref:P-loop containing nucleoside triphosphate hydrolase protein n=1 Tax=Physocladia obscura TaxID=109957 RepID=A0AAD5XLL1_9FUNG|nr:hypothetical protein HK100_001397 [Physocladia obscura]
MAVFPHIIGALSFNAISQLVLVSLNITMSLMIGVITDFLTKESSTFINNGYGLAFLLFGMQVVSTFSEKISDSLTTITNIRMSAAITSAVYKKTLNLAFKSRQAYPAGKINSLCGTDVNNLKKFVDAVNKCWTMPIQLVVSLYLVAGLLKVSTAVSAGVFVGIGGLAFLVTPKLGKSIGDYMKMQDNRTTQLREFLYGVKTIKYHTLEEYMKSKINAIRSDQIKFLKRFAFYFIILIVILVAQQILTAPLTLITYGALNDSMDSATVFVAFSLLSGLISISAQFSGIASDVVASFASYRRLQEFLTAEEIDQNEIPTVSMAYFQDFVVSFDFASFCWESVKNSESDGNENSEALEMIPILGHDSDIFTLTNINIIIKAGTLVAVVGATGSGKSSLLSAITGGMRKTGGELYQQAKVYGSIAYCPQEPWIISGTIEENITLLNSSLNGKCEDAIQTCALSKDIISLPYGLGTQIGEKGINLSGGQKARIALARAIVKNADIYILDDPMAALDAHVGKEIFSRAIKGTVSSGKTVIMATHQLHLLPNFDQILVLDGGRIVQNSTFEKLMLDTDGKLFHMMKDLNPEKETDFSSSEVIEFSQQKNNQEYSVSEDRETGAVSFANYTSFIKAGGILYAGFTAFFATLLFLVNVFLQLTLSAWTSNYLNFENKNEYLYIYSSLSVASAVGFVLVTVTIQYGCINASIYFHDTALEGLMAAPMSFFDTQPIGRILNRMTNDVANLDNTMNGVLGNFVRTFVMVFSKSYRELKRLNSIMQSPLSAHISETISGLSTILAYNAQDIFISKQLAKMDQSNLATMLLSHAQYWFMLRLDLIGSLVTLSLSLFGVTGVMNSAFIALALSSTISWAHSVNMLLMQFGETEANMVAVERLHHYGENLPIESARNLATDSKFGNWPMSGSIEIKDLNIAYNTRPDVPVISKLSLRIRSGEKIGIVGRTGSGKSTLVDSLFRIIEPSSGNIYIDGVDITTIGLKKLRGNLQMIPQNPILFDGTVRSNLDHESKFSDDEIWSSLESCGMKEYVAGLSEKLDSTITEGGTNLSAGQRQLICLAKVVLEKAKIIVMDEATSSIDGESDFRIQALMKTQFKENTVISIAHRLNTIAAFDRVLVLDSGKIAEFDEPHVLINQHGSIFGKLVIATGSANATVIQGIAKLQHDAKK